MLHLPIFQYILAIHLQIDFLGPQIYPLGVSPMKLHFDAIFHGHPATPHSCHVFLGFFFFLSVSASSSSASRDLVPFGVETTGRSERETMPRLGWFCDATGPAC